MKMCRTGMLAISLTLLGATAAFSQQGQTKPAGTSDTAFVRKNIHDNINEIQAAELAVQRAARADIKKAAQTLVTDHRRMLDQLLTIARESDMQAINETEMNIGNDTAGLGSSSSLRNASDVTSGAGRDKDSAGQVGNRGTGYDNSRAQAGKTDGDSSPHRRAQDTGGVNADKEHAGMNADARMKDMAALQNASGKEFESMWVSHMLGMHKAKVAELQAVSGSLSSSRLNQAVSQAIPIVRSHIKMLTALQSKKGKTGSGGSGGSGSGSGSGSGGGTQ